MPGSKRAGTSHRTRSQENNRGRESSSRRVDPFPTDGRSRRETWSREHIPQAMDAHARTNQARTRARGQSQTGYTWPVRSRWHSRGKLHGCQSGATKAGKRLHPRYKQMKENWPFESIFKWNKSSTGWRIRRASFLSQNAGLGTGKVTNSVVRANISRDFAPRSRVTL